VTATRFAGKSAIVTGAGSGIGAALTSRLLEEGAWVLAADQDPSGAPEGAVRTEVDVSDEAAVAGMVASAVTAAGRLDMMFNNAGIGSTTSVVDCTAEEWDRVFAVNSRGVFLGCKYAARQMLAQRPAGGVIVNTASVAGMVGLRDRAAYSASKGAVIALTRQVAIEYAGTGVRCNCVCPGTVDSPWVGRLLDASGDGPAARAALTARQPLGRLGEPAEIAAAMCYLASDEASFVTGSAMVIDGGLTAG
jgi:NAD(P)-dependent dehydrogenase (short-subunit alcohol dehydrogenase family)